MFVYFAECTFLVLDRAIYEQTQNEIGNFGNLCKKKLRNL